MIVSTASTPPILLISGPHRVMTFAISLRCGIGPSSTIGIFSTIAAMTASLTRDKDTLLAMRNVFNSTEALSTECPSANARSRDAMTSDRNSDSATASEEGRSIEAVGAEPPVGSKSESEPNSLSSSESESFSLPEDAEPASVKSRSEASSPGYRNILVGE